MSGALKTSAQSIREALNRKDLAAQRQRGAVARLIGVTDNDVLAIQHLAHAGRLTSSQLGGLLGLTSGGVAALVQRLERENFVARRPHPRDARSTLLELTPAIEDRAGDALAPLVQDIERLVGQLQPDQRRTVADFLMRVAEAAERRAAELVREADERTAAMPRSPVPGLWA
jgi:DNA-binding MarR family transcriptional regulator